MSQSNVKFGPVPFNCGEDLTAAKDHLVVLSHFSLTLDNLDTNHGLVVHSCGEDFGMFGRVEPIIPTSLFWLGAVNKKVYEKALRENLNLPSLHSDLFLPDAEPAIKTGVKAMTSATIDLFNSGI